MPTISVVLPTFNGGPLFAQVLAGLQRQRLDTPPELLIIDSGSTDNTLPLAKEAGAKIVQIPQSEFNHGLTRNRAIEQTTGDIIILLTQDAVPADEHLLANLIKPFEDPQVAGAFARQIPRPEHDVLVQRNINNWVAGSMQPRVSQITDRPAYEKLPPMERYLLCVFDNVCSALRRSVWKDIPLRENEFGEDIDWSKRTLEAGWKIAYEPTAAVVHSHDRPVIYEYRRTYMCHRTLHRLFGLTTIPARSYVMGCWWNSVRSDSAYVMKHERRLGKKIGTLLRIPALSWNSVFGQYRGARDEREGRGRKISGV